ncbi:transmembrane protein 200A [Osmerus eperlanus]|uniref:transmembrane protein 200A n=1 Tax=Osmerus eperlanus TaxID=29151 RepID=UPI002E0E31BB
MIATGGVITGLAALKRQDSTRSQYHLQAPPPGPDAAQQRKRKRRSDVVVVRGKVRLYSASGFFLVLGVLILMVGVAMAVLGYWPHKHPFLDGPAPGHTPELKMTSNGSSVTSDEPVVTSDPRGILARFLERYLHSERMRMMGPFTMGIGIFIFICANAILHENRDRETKVIHMRDMYSTVIDIHSLRLQEQKQMNGAYGGPQYTGPLYSGPYASYSDQELREEKQSASRLAANTLLTFSGQGGEGRGPVRGPGRCRGGSLRASSTEEEEGLLGEAKGGLLSPLYRDRSGSVFGFQSEHGAGRQWEERGGALKRCQTRSIVSSSISAFTLPVIKLNNCVIDEPEMDSITEDGEVAGERSRPSVMMSSLAVPVPVVAKAHKPPGLALLRSNSASEYHSSSSSRSSLSPGSASGHYLSPGAARKDFGSNNSLHMLSAHSKSLDLERGAVSLSVASEQRKHPSWPRLDRSSSKGYMRLEDREEPGDRLLAPPVAVQRDYTKKEKLLMISRSHNNLSFEHDDLRGSQLKRGSSETRF